MRILEILPLLSRMDRLIRLKSTGSLEAFSRRLAVSKKTVRNYINLLKSMGAEIYFSKTNSTYYYQTSFNLKDAIISFL